jgi:hypothetical protein
MFPEKHLVSNANVYATAKSIWTMKQGRLLKGVNRKALLAYIFYRAYELHNEFVLFEDLAKLLGIPEGKLKKSFKIGNRLFNFIYEGESHISVPSESDIRKHTAKIGALYSIPFNYLKKIETRACDLYEKNKNISCSFKLLMAAIFAKAAKDTGLKLKSLSRIYKYFNTNYRSVHNVAKLLVT